MTPEALAALHARAMSLPPPWDAQAMRGLLDAPGACLVTLPSSCPKYAGGAGAEPPPGATPEAAQNLLAFALGRIVLDEAELLTIAVAPEARGKGHGRACLRAFETACRQRGASRILLEVAATNTVALGLYRSEGFAEDGRRRNYYRPPGGAPVDAILMSKSSGTA